MSLELAHANHSGISFAAVGQELRATVTDVGALVETVAGGAGFVDVSGGTGSAQLQVCSGDPSVAANWVDAGAAVTANGSDSYSGQHLFARVSVTNAGGGIQVQLLLGNA